MSKMFKRKQFDPESFEAKMIKCSCFANLNSLLFSAVSKIESWGKLLLSNTQTRNSE